MPIHSTSPIKELKLLKQKPECKIICNEENDSVSLIIDIVLKCLMKSEFIHLYDDYFFKVNRENSCEEVLKVSADYVNFIFIYKCGGGE